MRMSVILKKFYIEKKEFVTSSELMQYCESIKLDYEKVIRYLISRGYLLRIFRGIFYIRTLDEIKLGKTKYNHLELVSKGLGIKEVKNWYFGLFTALKLNNMTHEYFTMDYIINDKIFRAKPMNIAGYKFKFIKLSPHLLEFGIIKNKLIYSDIEKTILDFIYLWKYNGISKEKIVLDIDEWIKNVSKEKIEEYMKRYPKTIREIVVEVIK